MAALTVIMFGSPLIFSWLHALKLSDTNLSNPVYKHLPHLVISLPALIVRSLPLDVREPSKLAIYPLFMLVALHALYLSYRFIARRSSPNSYLPWVLTLGLLMLPVVAPYFLVYDLSIFVVAGALLYGQQLKTQQDRLKPLALVIWISVNVYLILFMFINSQLAQPSLLILILSLAYGFFVKTFMDVLNGPSETGN